VFENLNRSIFLQARTPRGGENTHHQRVSGDGEISQLYRKQKRQDPEIMCLMNKRKLD
jgi:hypothetical protein